MRYKITCVLMLLSLGSIAQLYIQHGSGVHLQEHSGIYVQGELTSLDALNGAGTIYLSGDAVQLINANGFDIPVLSILNKKGATLAGDLVLNKELRLTGGNIVLNQFFLHLREAATIVTVNKFSIVTNASGAIQKHAGSDIHRYFIPLSNTADYTPLVISTRGKYHHAFVQVSASATASPNKPAGAGEFLNHHWKVSSRGVDGEVNATAIVGPGKSTLVTRKLSGYIWQDGRWQLADYNAGAIRANVKSGEAEIFAMALKANSLQPNPAVHSTKLIYTSEYAGRCQLSITDAGGRIIEVHTVSLIAGINQYNIDLGNLAKGVYDVSLVEKDKKTTLKLIKQ